MSDAGANTAAQLSRKIHSATDLQGVVRTMKAHAASSISQYEKSVTALEDYYRTIELGLGVCFRDAKQGVQQEAKHELKQDASADKAKNSKLEQTDHIHVIVFGSDQGLVGQFNQDVASLVLKTLAGLPGKVRIWAVGERVHARLEEGLAMEHSAIESRTTQSRTIEHRTIEHRTIEHRTIEPSIRVPTHVNAIAPLVGQLLLEALGDTQLEIQLGTQLETHINNQEASIYIFYNHTKSGALYEPVIKQLFPLDKNWQTNLAKTPWPTQQPPQILCRQPLTVGALIREYLFISLYRACAQSLACENASRLAAMLRAEKNIDEMLEELAQNFHRLRQRAIDEELFDVLAGYTLQEP